MLSDGIFPLLDKTFGFISFSHEKYLLHSMFDGVKSLRSLLSCPGRIPVSHALLMLNFSSRKMAIPSSSFDNVMWLATDFSCSMPLPIATPVPA